MVVLLLLAPVAVSTVSVVVVLLDGDDDDDDDDDVDEEENSFFVISLLEEKEENTGAVDATAAVIPLQRFLIVQIVEKDFIPNNMMEPWPPTAIDAKEAGTGRLLADDKERE